MLWFFLCVFPSQQSFKLLKHSHLISNFFNKKMIFHFCMSNQWLWFSLNKNSLSVFEACWVLTVSLSLNDELFKQVKASESPLPISILASSSVSGVTASWGKGIIEIRPPPALCLWPSRSSQPSQFPEPPRCLPEQPTRRTESKEAPGTPLIVHALGSSLARQPEEGPLSQGFPTAPHSQIQGVIQCLLWGFTFQLQMAFKVGFEHVFKQCLQLVHVLLQHFFSFLKHKVTDQNTIIFVIKQSSLDISVNSFIL